MFLRVRVVDASVQYSQGPNGPLSNDVPHLLSPRLLLLALGVALLLSSHELVHVFEPDEVRKIDFMNLSMFLREND